LPYELTINRFGVVPSEPILGGKGRPFKQAALVKAFFKQTDLIRRVPEFRAANMALLRVARGWTEWKTEAVWTTGKRDDKENVNEPNVVGTPPRNLTQPEAGGKETFETLVGLLPDRRMKLKIRDTDWVVRTRASMTGCALQSETRQTKLWWTIEGIPLGEASPNEEDAAAFVKLADAMQAAAMPHLAKAYTRSLNEITGRPAHFNEEEGEKLRISMADNEAGPVAELLSTLRFRKTDLAAIDEANGRELERVRDGLGEFRKFINDVGKRELPVTSDTIKTDSRLDGARGLLCRAENTKTYATFVAGFARSAVGTGFASRGRGVPLDELERFIRRTSPARQLSAELADVEARALDARMAAIAASRNLGTQVAPQ